MNQVESWMGGMGVYWFGVCMESEGRRGRRGAGMAERTSIDNLTLKPKKSVRLSMSCCTIGEAGLDG